jgi:adenine-specific DNA-methyltransferase
MAKAPRKSAPKTAKTTGTMAVDALTHTKDKRPNIPTQQLSSFLADGEPGKVLYSRDPSLDPQLVWKGKDAQDARPLEVPALPIYVQEKIQPQAIIEDLLSRAAAGQPRAADLFADFNGLDDLQKKLEFYQHSQHWTNRLILGDSLLVMTSLAEKERLRGQVQCIYFDPPYGIKFGSNWQVSTRTNRVKDAKPEDLTRQPEQIKAFRDTWELGIHSYLTYLRDRLTAARELLTESGSIFVQIGDENVHLVRCLLDEVFGSENFCSQIVYRTSVPLTSTGLATVGDFILWYAKDKHFQKYHDLFISRESGEKSRYTNVELPDGTRRGLTAEERANPEQLPEGSRVFSVMDLASSGYTPTCIFPFEYNGEVYRTSSGKSWKTTKSGMQHLAWAQRISDSGKTIRYVIFLDDFPVTKLSNFWQDTTGEIDKTYVVQTHSKTIERCLLMTTDPGDLVLDPTCGSGTTAYVAEQWGRRWITIDTSRVALSLARTRLMAARYPYYQLADSPAGRKKLRELGTPVADTPRSAAPPDIHRGFVYKTVLHVTLKSIANNPDIKERMTRDQIDAAIKKHADTETLYDQPYEDKGIVRVCGPFTVESLSPHRELPQPDQPDPPAAAVTNPGNYLQLILDNLRKAGVKGMTKAQRMTFARLDTFPGTYIQAEGTTDDGLGVRISVGPELGTVGDKWIKDAALEAIKGSKPDVLIVCAFSFEASIHEQTAELSKEMQFGKLRILPVRMNPDLAMFGDETGKELLKKTGAANLFTVFGEPDLKVEKAKGKVTVTIRGLDVFDPTTGEVRTGGTDDIACWFIDTDYDGQSFFVRQAYFCGADEPYEKLKKALRAEIDEGAWAKLYSPASLPFDPPKSGKIAVKVINHYGDEVLKVYDVRKVA